MFHLEPYEHHNKLLLIARQKTSRSSTKFVQTYVRCLSLMLFQKGLHDVLPRTKARITLCTWTQTYTELDVQSCIVRCFDCCYPCAPGSNLTGYMQALAEAERSDIQHLYISETSPEIFHHTLKVTERTQMYLNKPNTRVRYDTT